MYIFYLQEFLDRKLLKIADNRHMKVFLSVLTYLLLITDSLSNVVVSVCANSKAERSKAYKNSQFIKIKSDIIKIDGSCVEILTSDLRENLFIKYLRSKNSELNITSTNEFLSNRTCHLILTKEINGDSQIKKLGNKRAEIHLNETKTIQNKVEKSNIVVQEGLIGTISHNSDVLNIKCHIKKQHYKIQLWTSSKNFSINNTVQLSNGQRTQVGTYQETTNNSEQNIQIIKNSFKSKSINKMTTLFLEVQTGINN
jgi:hypothetical protein